jgi:uncharacterized membrane protein
MIFWTIVHLFGVVVGAGGAFASDLIFFSSVKDKIINHDEMRFLRLGSAMVWIGLLIIIISGIFLFLADIDRYLSSPKFLAKMTIVAVIIVNGLFFHFYHIPKLHRHAGRHLKSSRAFVRHAPWLVISGVVSIVSWISAIILGSLRQPPFNYGEIMAAYLLAIFLGIAIGLIYKSRFTRQ